MRFLPDQASRTGSRRFPGRGSLLRIRTRKIQREITRKKKEPESSQGHDRNTDTGSPGSSGNTDGKNRRLVGADAIDAPDNMWVPGMVAYPDQTCYTYIEQDMSTQRLNVISGKLNAYMNTAASHAKHPALHTLLFTLQTKLTKSDLKSLKKPYREPTATGSSSDSNIDSSTDSGYGFPSGRQVPGSSARVPV